MTDIRLMDAPERLVLGYLSDSEAHFEDYVDEYDARFWAAAMWSIAELRKRILSNYEDKTCLEIIDEFIDDVAYWSKIGATDNPFNEAFSYLCSFQELIETVDS